MTQTFGMSSEQAIQIMETILKVSEGMVKMQEVMGTLVQINVKMAQETGLLNQRIENLEKELKRYT